MVRRLFRSRTQRVIGGVCGGLGEYFNIDPVLMRVIFVFLGLANGVGILAYLTMWLVFPRQVPSEEPAKTEELVEKEGNTQTGEKEEPLFRPRQQRTYWLGIILAITGVVWLFHNLSGFLASAGLLPIQFVWWPVIIAIWPLMLILSGIIILVIKGRK